MSDQVAEEPTQETAAPEGFEVDFVRHFMMQRQGKWVVLYQGLLHLAHERGLTGVSVELIQYPAEGNGNTAIARATVTLEQDGRVKCFADVGDANAASVARPMAVHIIRMASTRAKARALRDAVNIGVTALEELAEADEGTVSQAPQVRSQASSATHPRQSPQPAPAGARQTQNGAASIPSAQPQGQAAGARSYVRVKIGESTWNVPAAIASLDEGLQRDYLSLRAPMARANNQAELKTAWTEVYNRREAMGEILFEELRLDKDGYKNRLEGKANGR